MSSIDKELLKSLFDEFISKQENEKIEKSVLTEFIKDISNKFKKNTNKYNIYVKEESEKLKNENSQLSGKEKLEFIAKKWNDEKLKSLPPIENIKIGGNTPRKALGFKKKKNDY